MICCVDSLNQLLFVLIFLTLNWNIIAMRSSRKLYDPLNCNSLALTISHILKKILWNSHTIFIHHISPLLAHFKNIVRALKASWGKVSFSHFLQHRNFLLLFVSRSPLPTPDGGRSGRVNVVAHSKVDPKEKKRSKEKSFMCALTFNEIVKVDWRWAGQAHHIVWLD